MLLQSFLFDVAFVEKGSVNLGGNVTTNQRCEQLGIPHIFPYRPKDRKALKYDNQRHRLTLIDNVDEDEVLAGNSSRL